MRILSYAEAVCEATQQEMERDSSVVLLGQGVEYDRGLLGTVSGLIRKFGKDRVIETPLAEDGMTGIAIGAAMAGLRPIHIHIRMDFLALAMNQLINIAAKARYMYGGAVSVPLVVRTLIGDGWGAQHSQGLHAQFVNIPGLKVVAPSTPFDAKGLLIQSIRDNNPVIFVEHFKLYTMMGEVPEDQYAIPLGRATIRKCGSDITLVGISYMNVECLTAAQVLEENGINAEVIDPISLAPLDMGAIMESVKKTRRLVVADCAWTSCGVSAEIAARTAEELRGVAVKRIGYAPVPSPNAKSMEKIFYPNANTVAAAAREMMAK